MLLPSDDYPAARRCSFSHGPILLTVIRTLRSVSKKSPVLSFFFLRLQDLRGGGSPAGTKLSLFFHPSSLPGLLMSSPPSLGQLWGLIHIASGAEKWPSSFLGSCVLLWVIQLSSPTRVTTSRPWAFGGGGPQRLPIWVYIWISGGKSFWKMEMGSCPLSHFFSFVTQPQPVPFLLSLVVLIHRNWAADAHLQVRGSSRSEC